MIIFIRDGEMMKSEPCLDAEIQNFQISLKTKMEESKGNSKN